MITRLRALAPAARPIPQAVRARMEAAFAADFSEVRVREDDEAAAMDAAAFTRGSEITFHPGVWDPYRREGVEALAHELAHVLQQRAGRVPGTGVTEDPALEAEAHEAGARAARGQSAAPALSGLTAGAGHAAVSGPVAPGAAPAQPVRFGERLKGLFRRGGGGGGQEQRDPDETPYQPIPAELRQTETPYQPIPSRAMFDYLSAESPYGNIPQAVQDFQGAASPYANIPPSLARGPGPGRAAPFIPPRWQRRRRR